METENIKSLQKEEAIKRMKELKLMPEVINSFIEENTLYYSERQNKMLTAVLYWVTNNEELATKIKEFERQTNSLVYHVQLLHTSIGDMYSFFYVSENIEEWEMDMDDLKDHRSFVYVWNGDIEEYGSIGFRSEMGGVVRTW